MSRNIRAGLGDFRERALRQPHDALELALLVVDEDLDLLHVVLPHVQEELELLDDLKKNQLLNAPS